MSLAASMERTKRRAGDYDQRIAAVVREARVRAHLTQSDLGRLLGVTFQQVQKYETGTNRLPASAYPILFRELGLTPELLFGQAEPSDRPVPLRSRASVELTTIFDRLDGDRQSLLMRIARELDGSR
ncbi:helix-turn-helix domain-containing protein [Brevundimonas bacteroides]|uniref:helix-turn-helix domain-containing protein n=1 Tax=Brevundimonas bacteroides TaxID=74311 RepID=UPI001FE14506|nr:helix-turn-helix transcriptional regulator [Brevundimonas bacteroides]